MVKTMLMSCNKNSYSAFSLIELSIVLIIIGLLIGGIVGGKTLIDEAKLSRVQQTTASSPVNSIEDVQLWMEATNTNSYNSGLPLDGDPIDIWNDNNVQVDKKINFSQSNNTYTPQYTRNGINNIPAIRFDGTDDFLDSERGINFVDNVFDIFIVAQTNASSNNQVLLGINATQIIPGTPAVPAQPASSDWIKDLSGISFSNGDSYNLDENGNRIELLIQSNAERMKIYNSGGLINLPANASDSNCYPQDTGYVTLTSTGSLSSSSGNLSTAAGICGSFSDNNRRKIKDFWDIYSIAISGGRGTAATPAQAAIPASTSGTVTPLLEINTTSNQNPAVYRITSDGYGNLTSYTNGVQTSTSTTTNSYPNSSLTIGNNFSGMIGEIVVFDRKLSAYENEEIHNYLTRKWNIK